MDTKIIVYYDLTAWEEIGLQEFDSLKEKCPKICKMLSGLGIMNFKIRTESLNANVPIQQGELDEQQQPAN